MNSFVHHGHSKTTLITHSVTQSLNHSLSQSVTQSLTHSLTHTFILFRALSVVQGTKRVNHGPVTK